MQTLCFPLYCWCFRNQVSGQMFSPLLLMFSPYSGLVHKSSYNSFNLLYLRLKGNTWVSEISSHMLQWQKKKHAILLIEFPLCFQPMKYLNGLSAHLLEQILSSTSQQSITSALQAVPSSSSCTLQPQISCQSAEPLCPTHCWAASSWLHSLFSPAQS